MLWNNTPIAAKARTESASPLYETLSALAAWLAEHGEPANVVRIIPHRLCGDQKQRARLVQRYENIARKRKRNRR